MGVEGRAPRRRRGGARHRRAHLRVHPSERGEGVVRERRGGARSHLEGGDRAARRAARVPRRARKRAKDTRLTRPKSRAVRAAQFRHQLMTRNSRLVLAALRISTSGVVGRHSRARARPASGPRSGLGARLGARASSACRGPPPRAPARGAPAARAPPPRLPDREGGAPLSARASPSALAGCPRARGAVRRTARRLLRVVALDVLGASASCAITALALLRVFYERHAYAHASPERVVPACIFLASKLEEEPRRVSDVVNATHRALYPKPEDPVVVTRARLRIDVAERDVEAIAAAETLLERSRRRSADGGGGGAATRRGSAFEPTKSSTTPRARRAGAPPSPPRGDCDESDARASVAARAEPEPVATPEEDRREPPPKRAKSSLKGGEERSSDADPRSSDADEGSAAAGEREGEREKHLPAVVAPESSRESESRAGETREETERRLFQAYFQRTKPAVRKEFPEFGARSVLLKIKARWAAAEENPFSAKNVTNKNRPEAEKRPTPPPKANAPAPAAPAPVALSGAKNLLERSSGKGKRPPEKSTGTPAPPPPPNPPRRPRVLEPLARASAPERPVVGDAYARAKDRVLRHEQEALRCVDYELEALRSADPRRVFFNVAGCVGAPPEVTRAARGALLRHALLHDDDGGARRKLRPEGGERNRGDGGRGERNPEEGELLRNHREGGTRRPEGGTRPTGPRFFPNPGSVAAAALRVGAALAGFRVWGRETSRGVGSAARGRRGAAGSRVSAEAGRGGASKETRWAGAAEGDDEAFAGWVSLDEGGGCGSGVPAWWEALGFDHDETEAIAGEMLESLRRGAEEEGGGRG